MTTALREGLYGADWNEAVVALVAIAYSGFDTVRLAKNTEDVVSRGETYRGCAFQMALPEDDGENLPTVKLVVDNVDQALTDALRTVADGADVTLELVLGSAPDVVESGPYYFRVKSATWNWQQVELTLGYEDLLNLKYPADALDPQTAPGLFK